MGQKQGEKVRERRLRIHGESPKFAWLLPLILLNFFVFGFGDSHPFLKTVSLWLTAATLALALYVSEVSRTFFLAVASLILLATAAWRPALVYHGGFEIVVVAIFNVLTALAPVAILRKVKKEIAEKGADSEVVLGSLCAYLYIGNWFAVIYRSVGTFGNAPFFAQPGADTMMNYIYFSFITLTTTGFGDLSPAFGPGRMLAAIEAVIGQLYLVSVVAIVVSEYRKRR